MIHAENKPGAQTNIPDDRDEIELQALTALSEALDGFSMDEVGALYARAEHCVETQTAKQFLAELRETMMSVMRGYLEGQESELANALSGDSFSIDRAQRGSVTISELYDCYVAVSNWPETFSPLLDQCFEIASAGFEKLDGKVSKFGEALRTAFSEIAEESRQTVEDLIARTESEQRQQDIGDLSKHLQETFQAAVDIEAVCAWRLGKSIRTIYRKIARHMEQNFDISVVLPAVPMDVTSAIVAGNRIPREW